MIVFVSSEHVDALAAWLNKDPVVEVPQLVLRVRTVRSAGKQVVVRVRYEPQPLGRDKSVNSKEPRPCDACSAQDFTHVTEHNQHRVCVPACNVVMLQ